MRSRTGSSIVALNYQTEDRMLELNRAKFANNGNCGYSLKPKCMCKGAFNPTMEDPLQGQAKTKLVLKIISGQQLPKPQDSMMGDRGEIIDPFVEVEIIGLPVDCCKQQTRVVDDNGFNPMWEETLVFTVHMPQIALVRFEVWDHDSIGRDFIGQRTIAFTSMMPGYRHIYLEGIKEASIFVHVAVTDLTGKVKSTNAMKGLIKKATKHTKGHKKGSLDFSTLSSDDRLGVRFQNDLDSGSQDSRNGSMSSKILPPAVKASLHQGAMSEPVKRSHKFQVQDSLEKRRGIVRMSAASNPGEALARRIKEGSADLENSSRSSSQMDSPRLVDSPRPEGRTRPSQTRCPEPEPQPRTPPSHWSHQDSPGSDQVFEWPEPPLIEELDGEQREQPWDSTRTTSSSTEPQPTSQPQVQPQFQPPHQPQSYFPSQPEAVSDYKLQPESPAQQPKPEPILQPLVAPCSPLRVRRTLQTPPCQQPSTPIRKTARSRSCPRKQLDSPLTPAANRKHAVHWQGPPPQPLPHGNQANQVKPIPNGLCLSDSESSSAGSMDSLELLPSRVAMDGDRGDGTLQREMNALFDQKMMEIRSKSPLFFNDRSTL